MRFFVLGLFLGGLFSCQSFIFPEPLSEQLILLERSLVRLSSKSQGVGVPVKIKGVGGVEYSGLEYALKNNKKIILLKEADITKLKDVGAIVNAANSELSHGDGVCGAIGNAAQYTGTQWDDVMKQAMPGSSCPTGTACITGSFALKENNNIDYIIHAVGPDCSVDGYKNIGGRAMSALAKEALKGAYQAALYLASGVKPADDAWKSEEYGDVSYWDYEFKDVMATEDVPKLQSIAFPFISSAIYGCYNPDAARVALNAILDFFDENPGASINTVYFSLFSQKDYNLFKKEVVDVFGKKTDNV